METLYVLPDRSIEPVITDLASKFTCVPVGPGEIASLTGAVLASPRALDTVLMMRAKHRRLIFVVVATETEQGAMKPEIVEAAHAFVSPTAPAVVVRRAVEVALSAVRELEANDRAIEALEAQSRVMHELNHIGVALSSERNTETLLELVVSASREITRSDAASLYLVEGTEKTGRRLRFRFAQNQSVRASFEEFTMPVSEQSIAGFVAVTGEPLVLDDVYDLPPGVPFEFNRAFDTMTGYHTQSMLTVPMLNAHNAVIGVLQLINHKHDPEALISSEEAATEHVLPYPDDLVEVALSLGSQAAVALENSMLYQDIQRLFEGFVTASVTAIEQRDPTTSGHSARVADLTVGLAEYVDRVETGPYRYVRFNMDQMTEIRYASLLHDFGKVGIRENVLVKAKKLYAHDLELLRWRFDAYRRALELRHARAEVEYLLAQGKRAYARARTELERELERELGELDEMWQWITQANEPTVLPAGSFDRLQAIAERVLGLPDGSELPLLTDEEVRVLSIPKGSLSEEERRQIEQHVVHTFNFLAQIPWTSQWREVPRIAAFHHEKMDGSGYPYSVRATEIPLQSRMMTIADIFDALTASDRPYKRAVPADRALGILESEVKRGQLDEDLFRIFTESKVYEIPFHKDRTAAAGI